jgi:hypothetical protein
MPTFQSQQALVAAPLVGAQAYGCPGTIVGQYPFLGAVGSLALNDVIEMVRLPQGTRVYDGFVQVPDLDAGTTLSLQVGYGGDPDYFIQANTVGQAGGIARFGATAVAAFSLGGPLFLLAEDTVDVLVGVAATTPGVGIMYLTVEFLPPGSY